MDQVWLQIGRDVIFDQESNVQSEKIYESGDARENPQRIVLNWASFTVQIHTAAALKEPSAAQLFIVLAMISLLTDASDASMD